MGQNRILVTEKVNFTAKELRISVRNRKIKYNKGAAQGNIINPALFNIFTENLL